MTLQEYIPWKLRIMILTKNEHDSEHDIPMKGKSS